MDIKWTFVGNGGRKKKKEISMRKEEETSPNSFSALACDDDEFDEDVNLLTMNDVDGHDLDELVLGNELPLPELHNSSHQLSQEHAHDRHKDVVRLLRSTVKSLQR